MTYKDMTFCKGDGCAQYNRCFRACTPKVEKAASKAGLHISLFQDPTKLDCYLPPKKKGLP